MKARKRTELRSSITGKLTRKLGKVRQPKGQTHVGFAWYRPEQWKRLRELAADVSRLEERYDDWLASAEHSLRLMRAQGITVERVTLDVEAVAEWCSRNGRPFDGKARTEYVTLVLRGQDPARGTE